MSEASCKMERKDENVPLTVGEKFVYVCEGSFPPLDPATLELRMEEKDKYALKIFKLEQPSAAVLRLESTSYSVGEHDLKATQLTDATNSIVLNGIKFKVESLQDPKEPQKEAFPPMGPLTIFPWLVLFLALAGVALLAGVVVIEAVRARLRRRQMQEIDSQTFQHPPMQEFYRSLRGWQRQYLFMADSKAPAEAADLKAALSELDQAFRLYLSRSHRLPAHKWGSNRVWRELQTRKTLKPEHLADLKLTLSELDQAQVSGAAGKLSALDLEQILKLVKAFMDEDDRVLREVSKLAQGRVR